MGGGTWLFLPAGNLGPYTKEIKLFSVKDGLTLGSSWIFECHDKERVITGCVERGGANPAWFLSYLEGGIGGVVSNECIMALVQGPWATGVAYSCGNAVNKKSGPFDIGLCLDVVKCLEDSGVCFLK